MRRILAVCGVAVVVAAAVSVAIWKPSSAVFSTEPVSVHASDLPPAVYGHGRYRGQVVRTSYPLRLQPTTDPLVWEFRPGSSSLPPTHRVAFEQEPQFGPSLPVVVVGKVVGISPDALIRFNNVPGVVVIESARVVPPASP